MFEIIVSGYMLSRTKHYISTTQHGFMPGRSVCTNLLEFTSSCISQMEQKAQVDAIYTDIKTAFDRLDHTMLLCKISRLGASHQFVEWLSSYLRGRVLRVKLGSSLSSQFTNKSGVPQGSDMGPLLFALFFNDVTLLLGDGCKLVTVNQIYAKFVSNFLRDEQYLTGIETYDVQGGLPTTLQCLLDTIDKPLVLYTFQEFQKGKNKSAFRNINGYSQLETFVTRGTYETFKSSLIPSVARINPLAQLIATGRYITRQQVVNLFRVAWVEYSMPNIVLLNRVDNVSTESCVLNPFLTEPRTIDERNVHCQVMQTLEDIEPGITHTRQFLLNRAQNLHRYPLRIAIGNVELMSQPIYNKNKTLVRFSFLDGEIVDIMRRRMNFTAEFVILPSQLSTGFVYPNGSLGGSLSLIESGQIDLAANSRIIHIYQTKNVQYLQYLMTTKLVFIVPKNFYQSRSRDRVFFNSFTWTFYAINVALAVIFPMVLRMTNYHSSNTRKETYAVAVMRILAITLAVSTKLPNRSQARVAIWGILIYNLVSYSIWQAVIIKRLNSNNDKMDDIQDLAELLDSNLKLKIPVAYGQFVRPDASEFSGMSILQKKLYQEATVANNNVTGAVLIADMVHFRASAVLIHDIRSDVVKSRFYDDTQLQSFIHVINDHVFEFYTAMALPKKSLLVDRFNQITKRCVESGIVVNQLAKIPLKGQLYQIQRNRNNTGFNGAVGAKRFELHVLRYVFYCYFGLNGLAIVVFLGEIFVHRMFRRKVLLRGKAAGRTIRGRKYIRRVENKLKQIRQSRCLDVR
ncbi:uncharacterized protein LOC129716736 [Wyeomyia smithii]|uniref:uncharacterized protein LOC129716736 n=1 Tax=Wyeomyia smithii TaxID=174621 RepID=UPI002467E6AC|nr:uncharacterized protein LOC129716736 [Wyeomyia smithii]